MYFKIRLMMSTVIHVFVVYYIKFPFIITGHHYGGPQHPRVASPSNLMNHIQYQQYMPVSFLQIRVCTLFFN